MFWKCHIINTLNRLAGTVTRGLCCFTWTLAHVLLPLSGVFKGVSLNCVWLYKNPNATTITVRANDAHHL